MALFSIEQRINNETLRETLVSRAQPVWKKSLWGSKLYEEVKISESKIFADIQFFGDKVCVDVKCAECKVART